MSENIYIHYGTSKFDFEMMEKYCRLNFMAKDPYRNKPFGLWASDEKSEFGWKEWCEGEKFWIDSLDKYFKFKLKDDTNLLVINSEDDIIPYIIRLNIPDIPLLNFMSGLDLYRSWGSAKTSIMDHVDRDRLCRDYDGMSIPNYHSLPRFSYFYGYDCDCICVWNPSKVIPLKEDNV